MCSPSSSLINFIFPRCKHVQTQQNRMRACIHHVRVQLLHCALRSSSLSMSQAWCWEESCSSLRRTMSTSMSSEPVKTILMSLTAMPPLSVHRPHVQGSLTEDDKQGSLMHAYRKTITDSSDMKTQHAAVSDFVRLELSLELQDDP